MNFRKYLIPFFQSFDTANTIQKISPVEVKSHIFFGGHLFGVQKSKGVVIHRFIDMSFGGQTFKDLKRLPGFLVDLVNRSELMVVADLVL